MTKPEWSMMAAFAALRGTGAPTVSRLRFPPEKPAAMASPAVFRAEMRNYDVDSKSSRSLV